MRQDRKKPLAAIHRREIPQTVKEEDIPELFHSFYKEYRDDEERHSQEHHDILERIEVLEKRKDVFKICSDAVKGVFSEVWKYAVAALCGALAFWLFTEIPRFFF